MFSGIRACSPPHGGCNGVDSGCDGLGFVLLVCFSDTLPERWLKKVNVVSCVWFRLIGRTSIAFENDIFDATVLEVEHKAPTVGVCHILYGSNAECKVSFGK